MMLMMKLAKTGLGDGGLAATAASKGREGRKDDDADGQTAWRWLASSLLD